MYCTISVPFYSEENQWSRDGKTWTDWNKVIKADTPFVDTWTGLKPNTKYTGYYRFKRKYNGVGVKQLVLLRPLNILMHLQKEVFL